MKPTCPLCGYSDGNHELGCAVAAYVEALRPPQQATLFDPFEGGPRARVAFTDSMTLGEARDELRCRVDKGEVCPCCRKKAKVYKRPINSSMARDLIAMYRVAGGTTEFVYLQDIRKRWSLKGNREESKLRWWGLVEEENIRRPDGGRAGWWRVTELGERFVLLQATVPKYVREYDSRPLERLGPPVTIRDCLGQKFDYGELMAS